MFVVPLAFIFSFYVRNFTWVGDVDLTSAEERVISMRGLQYGFVIGLTHQIIAYMILLGCSDWHEASEESKKRQLEGQLVKLKEDLNISGGPKEGGKNLLERINCDNDDEFIAS